MFYWNTEFKSFCSECKCKASIINEQNVCDVDDGSVVTGRILPQYNNCPFKRIRYCKNSKKLQLHKSISILGQDWLLPIQKRIVVEGDEWLK